uniref:Uncharacterized protein n=1 Tax=Fagus sylvatica TaxID=28930 RepID=A0A2N9HZM3_FAGSY
MSSCVCVPPCRVRCSTLCLPMWQWLAAVPHSSVLCAGGLVVTGITRSSG